MNNSQALLLIGPLLIIQLALIVLALVDLARPERKVVGGNKVVWAVVIVLGELLGPIIYFAFGRRDA